MKMKNNHIESGFTLIEAIITLVVVGVAAAMMAAYFGTSITQSATPVIRLQAAGKLNRIMEKLTAAYSYPHWRPSTTYAAGAIILPTASKRNGLQYISAGSGTSSGSEPTWPATGTIGDGSVSWTQNGAAPALINLTWQQNTTYSANTIIVNGNYQYITISGGTSGTAIPTWPTTSGATITESTGILWQCIGTPAPTTILHTLIGAEGGEYEKSVGGDTIKYRVIENKFIKFNASNAEDDNCTLSSCNMLISGVNTNVYGQYLKVTLGLHSADLPRTDETMTTLFVRR